MRAAARLAACVGRDRYRPLMGWVATARDMLREFLTPDPLTPEMVAEIAAVANNPSIAASIVFEHELARRRVLKRQRGLFTAYCALMLEFGLAAGAFATFWLGFPTTASAWVFVVSLVSMGVTYLILISEFLPNWEKRDDDVRISSATAASRASNAVIEGVDLDWRRNIGDGIAGTADTFRKRHRRLWFVPASASPLNLTNKRLGRVCARAIRTMVERALTTADVASLRDDLWRLHLRAVSADFDGVVQLKYAGGVTQQESGDGGSGITWRQILVAIPIVFTLLTGVFNFIWGGDASLLDVLQGDQTPTPAPTPSVGS